MRVYFVWRIFSFLSLCSPSQNRSPSTVGLSTTSGSDEVKRQPKYVNQYNAIYCEPLNEDTLKSGHLSN